jgi:hypothetical protein
VYDLSLSKRDYVRAILVFAATLVAIVGSATAVVGQSLFARTLDYHDPDGTWMNQTVELRIETGYADGSSRVRLATLDYATADYTDRSEKDGRVLQQQVVGEECRFFVDGAEETDAAVLEELGLGCERARMLRNYVSYLWGLPMKLRDRGARIADEPRTTLFQGQEVLDLMVTYDPEVGTDVWHMYIDPSTGRLVGYAFYKSPAEEHGEYIVLEDEITVGTARIPSKRHWYRVPGDEFLGTDTLIEGRIVESVNQ